MHPLIEHHRQELKSLAAKYGVADIRVFGSMAREDATESSNVDLLVRPLPGTTALDLGGLLMDAQDLLHRRVDLVSERALSPSIRDRVMADAISL